MCIADYIITMVTSAVPASRFYNLIGAATTVEVYTSLVYKFSVRL